MLSGVSFTAFGGEILGIAGIAGSGQKELLEAIAGLQKAKEAQIRYFPPESGGAYRRQAIPVKPDGEELVGKNPTQIEKNRRLPGLRARGPAGHGPGGGHGHGGQHDAQDL